MSVYFLPLYLSKIKEKHKPVWTKLPNTCAPTQASVSMSPNTLRPPTFTFNPSISPLSFPFIPHSVHGGGGRSFAFCYRGREGKVRPSPLLCLLLSFLSSMPPSLPTSAPIYSPGLCLPPSFCLWHTAIGLEWSEVRKGEGGTHARHWTSDPSTRWTFSCRLPISSHTLSVFPIITLVSLPFLGQEHKG